MVIWLKNLNLNEAAVQKVRSRRRKKLNLAYTKFKNCLNTIFLLLQFVNEDLTHSDVLQLMSRDDLRRLGLKAGPELRVWKAILGEREVAVATASKANVELDNQPRQ